jgi:hypothetical protein
MLQYGYNGENQRKRSIRVEQKDTGKCLGDEDWSSHQLEGKNIKVDQQRVKECFRQRKYHVLSRHGNM